MERLLYRALHLGAGVPSTSGVSGTDFLRRGNVRQAGWALFLTALIAAPWMRPGYIFATDWPGPKTIPYPTDISSSALLQVILATASRTIGGEATTKVLLIFCIFAAALLAARAAPVTSFGPAAAAATLYVINPFVYGRLQYGQLYLLAGYAIIPWVATRLRLLFEEPDIRNAVVAAAALALLAIPSLHLFFMSGLLIATFTVTYVASAPRAWAYAARLARLLGLTVAVTLLLSAYWIVPLFRGIGPEGSRLAGIGSGDLGAFAAVPDTSLGLLPNLLGLYGFWAEAAGRFSSMKVFVPLWPLVLAALLAVCVAGVVAGARGDQNRWRPWIAGLVLASTIALVLEAGTSSALTAGLVAWLSDHFKPYEGVRDAGKWAAMLALTYSQLFAFGAAFVVRWVGEHIRSDQIRPIGREVAMGALVALPLYYGNGLLFGIHGEIAPSQYPPGWYQAERVIANDRIPPRTLFLPWHQYMSYSFVHNQNSVVASPAPTFFSVPIVSSEDPEVPGVAAPMSPDQQAVSRLVSQGASGEWAPVLAERHLKFVLLAREVDWRSYGYLDSQPGLVKIADFGSIELFRNTAVS